MIRLSRLEIGTQSPKSALEFGPQNVQRAKMDDSKANNPKTAEDTICEWKATQSLYFLHAKFRNSPFRGFSKITRSTEIPPLRQRKCA